MTPCIPHQKITTDTTEFKYYEIAEKGTVITHKTYLDSFLDFFNREIISYSFTKQPLAQGLLSALEKDIDVTSDCSYRRTFLFDQGWVYPMRDYATRLKDKRIFQSMSRKGTCLDNSAMENLLRSHIS